MWSDLHTRGTAVRQALAFAAIGFATLLGGCISDGLIARVPSMASALTGLNRRGTYAAAGRA
jgi:hypothetical protein